VSTLPQSPALAHQPRDARTRARSRATREREQQPVQRRAARPRARAGAEDAPQECRRGPHARNNLMAHAEGARVMSRATTRTPRRGRTNSRRDQTPHNTQKTRAPHADAHAAMKIQNCSHGRARAATQRTHCRRGLVRDLPRAQVLAARVQQLQRCVHARARVGAVEQHEPVEVVRRDVRGIGVRHAGAHCTARARARTRIASQAGDDTRAHGERRVRGGGAPHIVLPPMCTRLSRSGRRGHGAGPTKTQTAPPTTAINTPSNVTHTTRDVGKRARPPHLAVNPCTPSRPKGRRR
jgi:hypothetical protein